MTDYTELVKALRICGKGDCVDCDRQRQDKCLKRHWNNENLIDGMLCEAAAAIEDLQAEVDTLKRTDSKRCQECLYLGQPVGEQLIPKRGKWIIDGAFTYNLRELNGKAYEPVYRCSCCNRQTESYLRLDEPKMPEDADFPEYCPHCGAKMTGEQDVE